jgi:hypothetical protein
LSKVTANEFDLDILRPDGNIAYLPRPIPAPRDTQIRELIALVIAGKRVARFRQCIEEGHANVLRVFAERMASAAVRNNDPQTLQLGLIALLLAWRGPDSRDALTILPLYYDASHRLGLQSAAFVHSVRQTIGDALVAPLNNFLTRAEANKSLQVMGYSADADEDGFRYIRNW